MGRLSIAVKLPLGIAILLAVVCGSLTVLAYRQVRSLVVEAASDRLDGAASQMSSVFSASAAQRLTALDRLTAHPAIARLLLTQQAGDREPAAAALRAYLGNLRSAEVEVLDAGGQRVLAAGAALDELPQADRTILIDRLTASAAEVGPFARSADGLVTYWVGGSIRRDGQPIGYIVERRRYATSSATVGLLTGLIGPEAVLLVGNAEGDVWVDMADPAARPAPAAVGDGAVTEYRASGSRTLLVRTTAIDDAPWLVAVGLPRAPIMAPAYRFLTAALAGSLLLVMGGALVGWIVSRRITRPLAQLTGAAEAIAASGSAEHVTLRRQDEIGRLAGAFNAMSDEVWRGRERLEALVADLERRVTVRTADLETANRDLEAFSYSVSHDLRAPLRAIHGFSRILLEDHAGELSAGAQRYLRLVSENTTRMGELIDDLLMFSRLGRQAIHRQPVRPADVARRALDDLSADRAGRQVTIRVDDLPPCEADPALLLQVYVNLLSNAIKFTRRCPEATIEVGAIAGNPSCQAYFVRDNGTGFDMKYAHKLFGVFQRLHAQEEFEGTGVGLAIVHRIISRHGGRVWAEAAPDAGATFYFTLSGGETA